MAVFDAKSGLSDVMAGRGGSLVVVCLCAAWCDTCTAFRTSFERIAEARPRELFIWLDVEDDSAICGDIDIENFPTLAIYRGDTLLHFGVSLPQEGNIARLIAQYARDGVPAVASPAAITYMASQLRTRHAG